MFNDDRAADDDHLFQRLCHQAVLACGADMAAVERYVMERLEAADPAVRQRIKRDLERVLGFRPPDRTERPN